MEQNLKELLLKDLCARLPYGVVCHINGDDTNTPRKLSRIEVDELDGILLDFWTDREDYLSIQVYLSEVKPYLRPMSSMTEGEKHKLLKFGAITCLENGEVIDVSCVGFERHADVQDYLNICHFDYHGLIEKGLALEAHEGMYDLKEK